MPKNLAQYLLAFVVLCIGLHFFPLNLIGYDFTFLPGDHGDTRFNNYILEHGYNSFFQFKGSFWDAPFMYPLKNAIALSDNLLGSMPFYAVFRIFGANRETALQLWFVFMFILNFAACFYVSNKISKKIVFSALVAYVFAFALPVMTQVNHIQLMPRFMIPFMMYFAYRFATEYKSNYFLFLLISCVWQIYCGVYIGFLSALVIIVFVFIHFTINKEWFVLFSYLKKKYLVTGFYLLIAAVLLYPLMSHYIAAKNLIGMSDYDSIKGGIPRLSSYLYAAKSSVFWQDLSKTGDSLPAPWEHQLFPGILVFLSLLFILFCRYTNHPLVSENKKLWLTIAYTIIIVVLFTSMFSDFSLFKFVRMIPGFSALRAVSRIIFPLLLLLSFLLIPFLTFTSTKKYSVLLLSVLGFFILAEQLVDKNKLSRVSIAYLNARHNALLNVIDKNELKDNRILVVTTDNTEESGLIQLDAMMVSQQLGVPCVNGYSSTAPPHYGGFWGKPSRETLEEWSKEHSDLDTTRLMFIKHDY
jgi:hypothetical protein